MPMPIKTPCIITALLVLVLLLLLLPSKSIIIIIVAVAVAVAVVIIIRYVQKKSIRLKCCRRRRNKSGRRYE